MGGYGGAGPETFGGPLKTIIMTIYIEFACGKVLLQAHRDGGGCHYALFIDSWGKFSMCNFKEIEHIFIQVSGIYKQCWQVSFSVYFRMLNDFYENVIM